MSKKILIVDDEEDFIMNLGYRLSNLHYQIVTANNGVTGLEKAREHKPDLIIVDDMMPNMDGYKMAGLLKMDSQFKDVPIIMHTAKCESDIELNEEAGISTYVTKLIDFEKLHEKIEELLA